MKRTEVRSRHNKRKLKFASLFCGCGGFDLGFIQEGYESVVAYDNDSNAVATYNHNFSHPAELFDLNSPDADFSHIKDIDVLLAGPPCQGFSTAGKRRLDDPRNQLILRAAEIAVSVRPKVFIVENVRGIIAGSHKTYWDELQEKLKQSGYNLVEFCIDARSIGIAQMRKRVILIAWLGKKKPNIELPTENPKTLKDVIRDSRIRKCLNHNPKYFTQESRLALIATRIKPGQKLSNVRNGNSSVHTWDIPEVFGSVNKKERGLLEFMLTARRQRRVRDVGDADPLPVNFIANNFKAFANATLMSLNRKGYVRQINKCYDLKHTFNGKYRRLRWDEPSYTVDTRFGNPIYFLHPEENRGLTVREAARIQGFPDNFEFLGEENVQYRMIGNAVPPAMSQWVARTIREQILKK
jgi:DNA (cytosine-5)-methyltransferase 1